MSTDAELLAWSVVANIQEEGLKHFSQGTKVWVLPPQWGDGWDQALVVGRHRGSRKVVQLVVPLKHLGNFRVQGVYAPAVHRELTKPFKPRGRRVRQWQSEEEATSAITRHPVTAERLASNNSD